MSENTPQEEQHEVENTTQEEQQEQEVWEPSPYLVSEKKYYVSPKLSDVYDRQRLDVPNGYYTKKRQFRTNEEIMSIWAAPVENFELTEEDIELAKTLDQSKRAFRTLLYGAKKGPCYAHYLNFGLDNCKKKQELTEKNKLFKKLACDGHIFKLMECQNRHRKWYDARYNEVQKIIPGVMPEIEDNLVRKDRPLNDYPKYNTPSL